MLSTDLGKGLTRKTVSVYRVVMPAPRRPNTEAATAAVRRKAQDRKADELRAAGWMVSPPNADGTDAISAPHPPIEALRVHQSVTNVLSQWTPTVHRLVRDRIAALMEAHGPYEHPLETAEQYAQRVLAGGQRPFPTGECLYDNLNNNTGYEHIRVGYGLAGEGELRITYTGWYPHWAEDGESYDRRVAEIHCPGWLVTDPDGEDRYRAQTAELAEAVRQKVAAERAAIDALLDDLRGRSGRASS